MKAYQKTFLLVTLAACLASTSLVVIQGCGTTPETKITQGAQIVITSVNDAMAEWRDYVNAGKATRKQIDTVKNAYNGYYASMKTLQAVCERMAAKDPTATVADLTAANSAVKAAEDAVMAEVATIINAVIKKV